MVDSYSEERLKYLAGQIMGMFSGAVGTEQLGSIALEIMVIRENMEEIIKGKKYSKEEKDKARKTLEQLREAEKNIVRLYILTMLERTPRKKAPFLDYMMSKHLPTY